MQFHLLTLFPEALKPYANASILGRAQKESLITINFWNIRDFTDDTHHTVDDTPYGGGAGMVMKIEPIDRALQAVEATLTSPDSTKRKIVVLSARGQKFTQATAHDYAALDSLILICGRYEGIDQRVADHLADEEISIGPYVLAGGELPALIIVETVARLIPGVLGNPQSLTEESFNQVAVATEAMLEYPHYTKPAEYKGWKVPDILLSGNHQAIDTWRRQQKGQ